jgi:DNA polymerase-3 subunit epsilon
VLPLSQLEVLVVDCQATAAAPRGHLLEVGWAHVGSTLTEAHACLIALPEGERIPAAVTRITGISDHMTRDGIDACIAWRALSDQAARLARQPAPTVIHFARFEQPFLNTLAGGVPPLDVVCSHDIARRLLPGLPRRSLRALTGYFGRSVGPLRRCAEHVEATAFIWRKLVPMLEGEGISTWRTLLAWLAAPVDSTMRRRRVWPMPRAVRLSLPEAPGVYRMLRTGGDVLYVGKASSLRDRVNSYFRHQHRVSERMLEMLSQVRELSFEVTPSALEAALLEPDEIKRHRPAYNVALTVENRAVWFTSRDFGELSPHPSARCSLGPFPSAETLNEFAALARAGSIAPGRGRRGPDPPIFQAGYARLCAAHGELSRTDLRPPARLLRLGTRLWQEGRRDRDDEGDGTTFGTDRRIPEWTPAQVQLSLERLALRAAAACRRARWLTRLVDAAVVWSEPGIERGRLIVIDNGEIVIRTDVDSSAMPPIPPGHQRSIAARQEAFTVARFDRVRVLTTELKRLVANRAPVALRFGAAPPLSETDLADSLWWL